VPFTSAFGAESFSSASVAWVPVRKGPPRGGGRPLRRSVPVSPATSSAAMPCRRYNRQFPPDPPSSPRAAPQTCLENIAGDSLGRLERYDRRPPTVRSSPTDKHRPKRGPNSGQPDGSRFPGLRAPIVRQAGRGLAARAVLAPQSLVPPRAGFGFEALRGHRGRCRRTIRTHVADLGPLPRRWSSKRRPAR